MFLFPPSAMCAQGKINMTVRPIIFSPGMVRALLDGRKTQTRRLAWRNEGDPDPQAVPHPTIWQLVTPGTKLWVREAWGVLSPGGVLVNPDDFPCYRQPGGFSTRAFHKAGTENTAWGLYGPPRWRSGVLMQRSASRLTLTVTDVRVERLNAISEDDARAEGFEDSQLNDGFGPRDIGGGLTVESPGTFASASGMFLIAWKKLHPDWDGYTDPWVVALRFTVERRNVDA